LGHLTILKSEPSDVVFYLSFRHCRSSSHKELGWRSHGKQIP
jgi:hypothetical protein